MNRRWHRHRGDVLAAGLSRELPYGDSRWDMQPELVRSIGGRAVRKFRSRAGWRPSIFPTGLCC